MRQLFLSVIVVTLVSCTQELEEQNQTLQSENIELKSELARHDSIFQDFITIQNNLEEIRSREMAIGNAGNSSDIEGSKTAKEQILDDINAINGLLEQNRTAMSRMNEKLKRYSYEVGKFKTIVENLNKQIAEKDTQIVVLKENLVAMNFEVSQLNMQLNQTIAENEKNKAEIQNQDDLLNEAFYAIGTYKDLSENGVLSKEGGLVGIGKTKTISEDFNTDYFTQVNKATTTEIPLDYSAKKLELISNHPSDSYELVTEEEVVKMLKIKDPTAFWNSTNYLVIVLK